MGSEFVLGFVHSVGTTTCRSLVLLVLAPSKVCAQGGMGQGGGKVPCVRRGHPWTSQQTNFSTSCSVRVAF